MTQQGPHCQAQFRDALAGVQFVVGGIRWEYTVLITADGNRIL